MSQDQISNDPIKKVTVVPPPAKEPATVLSRPVSLFQRASSYGPTTPSVSRNNSVVKYDGDLDGEGGKPSFLTIINQTLVHGKLLETELILLAFSTGILDAVTYLEYHVFTSIQTGNTVELAVFAVNQAGDSAVSLQHLGIVIGGFVVGGTILGQLGLHYGPRRRSWLLLTNFVQTVLVGLAAVLLWKAPAYNEGSGALGVLLLLAFASGGQLALARTVNVPDVTTIMITAAYIDFFIDPKLFQLHNRSRTRRFLSICALLGGGFVGSASCLYLGSAAALGISTVCKMAITLMFLINKNVVKPIHSGTVSMIDLESCQKQKNMDQAAYHAATCDG